MAEERSQQPLTAEQAEAWRARLRWTNDGLDQGFARPDGVEPLATRIERADRVGDCRAMTLQQLREWADEGAPIAFYGGVWANGVQIDLLLFTWKGVFCVWSIDYRWTVEMAALVEPARARIQAELPGWPGKVETLFHSPREKTSVNRYVLYHPTTGEPFDAVSAGGRLDEVLFDWRPVGGFGLDPEWITWLCKAGAPRWWHQGEDRPPRPDIPVDERL